MHVFFDLERILERFGKAGPAADEPSATLPAHPSKIPLTCIANCLAKDEGKDSGASTVQKAKFSEPFSAQEALNSKS